MNHRALGAATQDDDDLLAGYVAVPAHQGWLGLHAGEGNDVIFFMGEVVAWVINPTNNDPEAYGITPYGQAAYVVSPTGFVTHSGCAIYPTVEKFLSLNHVDAETTEMLRARALK